MTNSFKKTGGYVRNLPLLRYVLLDKKKSLIHVHFIKADKKKRG